MNEYEVEATTGQKEDKFQVKWKGYKQKTWELRANLTNCENVFRLWQKRENHSRSDDDE